MLLLLLLACHVDRVCVTEEFEVAADDPLGDLDFTVADLVADLAGVRTFPAVNEEGAAVTAELAMARADSPAIFSDASWENSGLRPGLGLSQELMFVTCDDTVSVPFDIDLASSDGSVALAGEVDAFSQDWGDTTEGVGGVSLFTSFDGDGTLAPDASVGSLALQFDGPDLTRVDVSSDHLLLAFPPPVGE